MHSVSMEKWSDAACRTICLALADWSRERGASAVSGSSTLAQATLFATGVRRSSARRKVLPEP